ncbi:MAG TPA: RNA methyltransferase [Pyrinomonadaceae bacterium]|jgi:TrmH family RNA methyltransferase
MQKIVTSRDNQLVKQARAVRDGKALEQIFVEGLRLCEEAARSSVEIEDVLHTERLAHDERGLRLLQELKQKNARLTQVSEPLMLSLSDTKTPQGIIVLARRPRTEAPPSTVDGQTPLVLIMHRLNNPANAGAILRTAEAAGATLVVTTAGSTDIFSPRALRGAMGSSFRLPLWTNARFEEVINWCSAHKIKTACADALAERTWTEIDWTRARALIVGTEASGLTEEEILAADEAVRIPMLGEVESLNVAVASAILLYEAARQRNSQQSAVKSN